MPETVVNLPSKPEEGPEEGEIVSSDELEDISDSSMTFTPNGKSFSNSHHLSALSLSSVTENEMEDISESLENCQKRRRSRTQRLKKRKKIRKSTPNSDSSEDESISPTAERLKLQLKAAVHLEVEEAHRNSLRTRLRAMVKDLEPETELNSSVATKESVTVIDLVEQDTSSVIELPAGESDMNLSGLENNSGDSENSIVKNNKNEELDNELMELRLEALKTAIRNKFSKGRKRKKGTNENKENTGINHSEDAKEVVQIPEISPQPSIDSENNAALSPDEDEDVLRALLLASMSKKIMKSQPEVENKNPSNTKAKEGIRQNKHFLNKITNFRLNNKVKRVLTNTKKTINNVQKSTKLINMPQVKPLIITLDSESDSDWDISNSPQKCIKKVGENKNIETIIEKSNETESEAKVPVTKETIQKKPDEEIMSSVEKFLKEQRAKVESELNKATPPITKKTTTKPVDLEKSALKYLSESKREEYRKLQNLLKMKMKNVQAKMNNNSQITVNQKSKEAETVIPNKPINTKQVSKPAESTTLNLTVQNSKKNTIQTFISKKNYVVNSANITLQANKVLPANPSLKSTKFTQTEDSNVQLPKELEAKVHAFKLQELKALKRDRERKRESALMREKLRELQWKTNGRLQIQDKYKSLRPLVKTMIDLNKQQKHCDQEVERLTQELTKLRERQDMLHGTMSSAIVELIEEKKKLDISPTKTKELTLSTTLVTSTPIKPVTGKNLQSLPSPFTPSASKISFELKRNNSPMANTWEQSTIRNNKNYLDDVTLCPKDSSDELTVVDPNDIDPIIQESAARVAVLQKEECREDKRLDKVRYVSPFDSTRRKAIEDPFKIICPFEVNGTCKDPECSYNHFLK
ncbi:uncharacterized protein LOC126739629 [Anthonomus grandis grandis]|uniref:uncharacterized protein LOC126739629 n=1 Tax=Anthonomus grandis grandis TaxID=2921223 RepID=UPI002166282C|nr:uncharacterized protein LOC126739629 [Anthonomus grandis grandis]